MFYENSSLTKIHFLHIAKNYYIANKDPHFDLMYFRKIIIFLVCTIKYWKVARRGWPVSSPDRCVILTYKIGR